MYYLHTVDVFVWSSIDNWHQANSQILHKAEKLEGTNLYAKVLHYRTQFAWPVKASLPMNNFCNVRVCSEYPKDKCWVCDKNSSKLHQTWLEISSLQISFSKEVEWTSHNWNKALESHFLWGRCSFPVQVLERILKLCLACAGLSVFHTWGSSCFVWMGSGGNDYRDIWILGVIQRFLPQSPWYFERYSCFGWNIRPSHSKNGKMIAHLSDINSMRVQIWGSVRNILLLHCKMQTCYLTNLLFCISFILLSFFRKCMKLKHTVGVLTE